MSSLVLILITFSCKYSIAELAWMFVLLLPHKVVVFEMFNSSLFSHKTGTTFLNTAYEVTLLALEQLVLNQVLHDFVRDHIEVVGVIQGNRSSTEAFSFLILDAGLLLFVSEQHGTNLLV